MRFLTLTPLFLPLLAPSLATPNALYARQVEIGVRGEYPGWKTDLYTRDPETLVEALSTLQHVMWKRAAIAPNDGPGQLVTETANFISTLTTGCPRPGSLDYYQCKRCKDKKKRKRGLEERDARSGKGGGGKSKPKGGSGGGGGKSDPCDAWK